MKAVVSSLIWVAALCQGSGWACELTPGGMGVSASALMRSLKSPAQGLPQGGERLPQFQFSVLGPELCPGDRALAQSVVTYSFAFDRLFRVELRASGDARLLGFARHQFGPELSSQRVAVNAQRPTYRWDTASSYVTYRASLQGKVWREYLSISSKQQQEVLQRRYRQLESGGRP